MFRIFRQNITLSLYDFLFSVSESEYVQISALQIILRSSSPTSEGKRFKAYPA